ncbi:3-keto-disaccharide hydrolase [Paludisphaera mucosa]|uniref:DUF1080 domain-containing protein n=1 Tax=Paludisphaera mucosa TaxID=3030827 RepID=A0ABT6F4A2_9BACT|nr:DUF1080 domain-containing protein [Paludisphaera mucosa]MDG3002230.1 DUF1080 domain-containing protein [Paludisphaera mucosa]
MAWRRTILGLASFLGLVASGLCGDGPAEPVRPVDMVPLFNGRDLSGLSTWLKDAGRADPRRVFRVEDGVLHISGDGFGYVGTREAYRDYQLTVEYRWGARTDGGTSVRNSGVLLHANGPDGGAGGVWMSSVECQLAQGCVGDLIVIRGEDAGGAVASVRLTSDVVIGPDGKPRWKPGGTPRTFTSGQLWWSRHDPEFRELLDTRGREDVESPLGEWTRVECECDGSRIAVRVNGAAVDACYDVVPSSGRILLQTEGFELFVRKFEIRPLTK